LRGTDEPETRSPTRGRGVMDLSPEEYKAYIHAKMRRDRR
jgi:hypothetical protein